MSGLRVASAVMALLFFACAVLQYNDPDPVRWMSMYGAAAVVSGLHAVRGRLPLALPLLVAAAALVWGVWITTHIDGRFEWRHLAESMHAGTPQIEQSRESLGLCVVAAWMLGVAVGRDRPRPGERTE
jgi:hypothetical protein